MGIFTNCLDPPCDIFKIGLKRNTALKLRVRACRNPDEMIRVPVEAGGSTNTAA
jgi:hypothetical protein